MRHVPFAALKLSSIAFILLSLTVRCSAATVFANNPGALPGSAQDLTADFPTEIVGSIPGTSDPLAEVNMFAIDITNFAAFSAIVVPSTPFDIADTELLLFDSSGNGVYMNDDIDGSNTLSCLPALNGSPCPNPPPGGVGPSANGIYYLAITRSSNLPLDGSSNEIFTVNNFTDVVGPNGGVGPIANWDGNGSDTPDTDLINYDIQLTGTIPEPATWSLAALSAGCFALLRRKVRR